MMYSDLFAYPLLLLWVSLALAVLASLAFLGVGRLLR